MSHSNSYDEVAYLSMPIRETDPLVMATVAALFGVDAADPRSSDVLELGCGDAGNLISLASAYPGIRAIGFDPARAAIQRGRDTLERTGLDNVALHDDETAVDLEGTMDYVCAHGVLSWVDEDVCASVVESAARAARPGGLVSFSYRVFPYAFYELPARELAQRAIEAEERRAAERGQTLSWQDKVRIARERIQLAASVSSTAPQGPAMQVMADKWANTLDWSLFHDDLSGPLHPKRVTEVAELAAANGLTYVGELLPHDLWQYWFPEEFCKATINEAGPDAVRCRQLLDDLVGMSFHSSLFVKSDEAPAFAPSFGDREIHVRQYVHGMPNGAQQSNEISPGVAGVIREHHPSSVTAAQISEELGSSAADVERDLLRLYVHGLVRLSTVAPPVPAPAGDRPRTMPLVIEQIDHHQPYGSSRFHFAAGLDRSARTAILRLADGTRDRAALRRDLPACGAATWMSARRAGPHRTPRRPRRLSPQRST
jgi:SAM-dependent methyltransferase